MQNLFTYAKIGLKFILFCFIFVAEAQELSKAMKKRSFNDAKIFLTLSNYSAALPLILRLQRADTSNANLNYLVGICYLNQ